jgi:hypothetical protein
MDFFNPLFWSTEPGKYDVWKSVYPPLNFLILNPISSLIADGGDDPFEMRSRSSGAAYFFVITSLLSILLSTRSKAFKDLGVSIRIPLLIILALSPPALFAVERGNTLIFCLPLLTVVCFSVGIFRAVSIAVLINIKPYFIIISLIYLFKLRPDWFVLTGFMALLIFLISGLIVDENFLHFFLNLFEFSSNKFIFSIGGIISFSSSIDAFAYLSDYFYLTGSRVMGQGSTVKEISNIIGILIGLPFLLLITAMAVNQRRISFSEFVCGFLAVIPILSISPGAYTLIFLIPVFPVFMRMTLRAFLCPLLILIFLPLDVFTIGLPGQNFVSYLSTRTIYTPIEVSVMSLLRPLLGYLLLWVLVLEFALRTKAVNRYVSETLTSAFSRDS